MMKKFVRLIAIMLLPVFMMTGCIDDEMQEPPGTVEGYKPVYLTQQEAFDVAATGPRALQVPGKIYIYGPYLFLGESSKGIHIFDNSNPSSPQKIAFINIPGNHDMAVKSNILYADNATDLVVFDITDMNNIFLVKREKDVFPAHSQFYPDFARNSYFECVDTSLGVVIDWELTTLKNPKCYR